VAAWGRGADASDGPRARVADRKAAAAMAGLRAEVKEGGALTEVQAVMKAAAAMAAMKAEVKEGVAMRVAVVAYRSCRLSSVGTHKCRRRTKHRSEWATAAAEMGARGAKGAARVMAAPVEMAAGRCCSRCNFANCRCELSTMSRMKWEALVAPVAGAGGSAADGREVMATQEVEERKEATRACKSDIAHNWAICMCVVHTNCRKRGAPMEAAERAAMAGWVATA